MSKYDDMTLDALETISEEVRKAKLRKKKEGVRYAALRAKVKAAIASSGLPVDVPAIMKLLTENRTRAGQARVDVRYALPADPSKTWTGRGRKAAWLQRELANGRKLEDFEVEKV